ncbi:hypothetical protein GCM10010307_74910 [Streptomyces vastus]|uniref:Uncharacterized protein n=1 Tax=Streptomyces vastus TaxID=285451 RepID=A0ABN3RRD8_9ACTN
MHKGIDGTINAESVGRSMFNDCITIVIPAEPRGAPGVERGRATADVVSGILYESVNAISLPAGTARMPSGLSCQPP